jgi:hypothetical protein
VKLVEVEQSPEGQRFFVNPSFVAAVWPTGQSDACKLIVPQLPISAGHITVKGSAKQLADRIDMAMRPPGH